MASQNKQAARVTVSAFSCRRSLLSQYQRASKAHALKHCAVSSVLSFTAKLVVLVALPSQKFAGWTNIIGR